jgi:hypothetical protein
MIRSAFKQLLTQSPNTTVLIDHIFAMIKVLKASPAASPPPIFSDQTTQKCIAAINFFFIREMIK